MSTDRELLFRPNRLERFPGVSPRSRRNLASREKPTVGPTPDVHQKSQETEQVARRVSISLAERAERAAQEAEAAANADPEGGAAAGGPKKIGLKDSDTAAAKEAARAGLSEFGQILDQTERHIKAFGEWNRTGMLSGQSGGRKTVSGAGGPRKTVVGGRKTVVGRSISMAGEEGGAVADGPSFNEEMAEEEAKRYARARARMFVYSAKGRPEPMPPLKPGDLAPPEFQEIAREERRYGTALAKHYRTEV